ncbi:MAG: carbohydrate ABC transporter permease, partial [Myxococcales bacterium]|nr:carbohydrate ABC transporter permease [Myxococcales bacterium]
LPLAIALLREQGTGERWHVIMAGNVILSLPVLVVFAFAQRHIVRAVASR